VGNTVVWNATLVSPARIDQRLAHGWVHANFSHTGGVDDNHALWEPEGLREPARTLAIQMAHDRAEHLARIPAYYSRIGNELWSTGWTGFARRAFTLAENGFRKSLTLNPEQGECPG
jgi:hypothetical protein